MHTLTVPAQPSSLAAVSAFVLAVAHESDLGPPLDYRLRLVVDEMVGNIITHGYRDIPPDSRSPVQICAECDSEHVTVTIRDGGVPYDVTRTSPPTNLQIAPQAREPGGLGVYLVMHYVDELHFERVDGQNINRLTLRRLTTRRDG